MEIKTIYGNIDYDELEHFDIPKKTMTFLEEQKDAAELFFQDEVDLTDVPKEYEEDVQILAEVAIAENKFEDTPRAFAVNGHTGESLADIEPDKHNANRFSAGGSDWLVLTDDEADKEVYEYAENSIDDMGLEYFGEDGQTYIIETFLKDEWFQDAMQESHESYVHEMKDETADDEDLYVNRAHEEMVGHNILDVLEIPDEPDSDDFEDEDAYDKAYDAWDEKKDKAIKNMESEVENNLDELVEKMNSNYDSGFDYYKENFGTDDDLKKVIKDNDLIDWEEVIKWHIEEVSDRGSFLNHENGAEEFEKINYKGEDYEFYIYQQG